MESLVKDREHLGAGLEAENLFAGFRKEALDFFAVRNIKWHGPNGTPDASIVASQVSCVNCLFPFVSSSESLAVWLQQIYPELAEVLPINGDAEPPLEDGRQPYLSFEWIGERRYLNERGGGRGAFQTNADAVLRFRQTNGKVHVVLVEWKYCESDLEPEDLRVSKNGTNRVAIYEPELTKPGCQLTLRRIQFERLFRLPIYQMMRLQLLASAMQRHREMQADAVSVLHIAPRSNKDLMDAGLASALAPDCECSVPAVWSHFVEPGGFRHFATEDLIPLLTGANPGSDWALYLHKRYGALGSHPHY